jgi:hypothetical protein
VETAGNPSMEEMMKRFLILLMLGAGFALARPVHAAAQ